MKEKERKGIFRYWPLWAMIFTGIGLLGLIVERISKTSVPFSDALNRSAGRVIRGVLATLTTWIPFSLEETLLLFSPVLLAFLVYLLLRLSKKGLSHVIRFVAGVLSCAALAYGLFAIGYEPGYYGSTLDHKLGWQKEKVSAEDLYRTGICLVEDAEATLDRITFAPDGASVMPYTFYEMNRELNKAYRATCEVCPFIQRLYANPKPVLLSVPMTYTHLSGVYTFFITGEANVNTNYPDYIVATSAAHEMAHQRGIAREDEANMMAFLVCMNSDDPYLRYCGCVDVLLSVCNSLASADSSLHGKLWSRIPAEIKKEYAAYSAFFDRYRENKAAEVTENVNNTYIEHHGQAEGTKSYGLVVDLVVAYYKEK
ncbi:MAG: DUF3810 domain-containing protein [Ruminococcus sp.]|nr:DUF3810 domain-containing protein [Candidatus Apopatosoma intestinale]